MSKTIGTLQRSNPLERLDAVSPPSHETVSFYLTSSLTSGFTEVISERCLAEQQILSGIRDRLHAS